jgi:hypothetical protein
MRCVVVILVAAIGLIAGDVTSVLAHRWPADLCESLDREHH